MSDGAIQGSLQEQIMSVLWRVGEGPVDHVREGLPAEHRSAYTTVQTVLNRLADRGLVGRTRRGRTIAYAPLITEGEYLSRSIEHTLAGASSEARNVALATLIGRIDGPELARLQQLAAQAEDASSSPQ